MKLNILIFVLINYAITTFLIFLKLAVYHFYNSCIKRVKEKLENLWQRRISSTSGRTYSNSSSYMDELVVIKKDYELNSTSLEFKRLNGLHINAQQFKTLMYYNLNDYCKNVFDNIVVKLIISKYVYKLILVVSFMYSMFFNLIIRNISKETSHRSVYMFIVFMVAYYLPYFVYMIYLVRYSLTKFIIEQGILNYLKKEEFYSDPDKQGVESNFSFENSSTIRCFIAFRDSLPIGYVTFYLHKSNEITELINVYVEPEFRNFKIASHLINAGLFHCKINKMNNAVVRLNPRTQVDGITLIQKCSFKLVTKVSHCHEFTKTYYFNNFLCFSFFELFFEMDLNKNFE